MLHRFVSESFETGCRLFFIWKSRKLAKFSQLTHLMSMGFFYTLWKLWFSVFLGDKKKRLVSCNVLKSVFCLSKHFASLVLEKLPYIKKYIVQKSSKIKIHKGSRIKIQNSFTVGIQNISKRKIQNSSNFMYILM